VTLHGTAARTGRGDARGVPDRARGAPDRQRSLLTTGTIAALVVTGTGLAVLTLLVLVGFVAAPHAGFGLPAVLRTAAALWLVGHHVGFSFRGAGRIGMLPLGLVLLPGLLLWRAGRWVVRAAGIGRLRHVGYAALALAAPYAVLSGALALASRSSLESSSLPQAVAWGFLLALAAGGLGGARALAPWHQLIALLPVRARSVVVGVAGCLASLVVAGALVVGISLIVHLHELVTLTDALAPGMIGTLLLLLLQLGYLPNAIIWAISFALGPGFAFGSATVVAPTGPALAQLPAFPLLAALPPGLHAALPGWLEPVVLALPYLAGAVGGVLIVRNAAPARGTTPGAPVPQLTLDAAPLRGLACGAVSGVLLGLLAAVSGGPLGNGRLAAVGPSPWQVGLVSALELGIAAAVTAGVVNYLALRRAGALTEPAPPARPMAADPGDTGPDVTGHVIYLDRWAGEEPPDLDPPPGPSTVPKQRDWAPDSPSEA
jgi:Family of unknown function (DUF6350)